MLIQKATKTAAVHCFNGSIKRQFYKITSFIQENITI